MASIVTSTHDVKEIAFTVHPQNTQNMSRPCIIYQQIMFKAPVQVTHISFRNYYCASIIVKQLQSAPGGKSFWRTVLRKTLMVDAHFEDDAQDQHVLQPSEFNDKFDSKAVTALRFYLFQPSPNWRSFGLRDVMCYSITERPKVATAAATSPLSSKRIGAGSPASGDGMSLSIAEQVDALVDTLLRPKLLGNI